MVLKTNTYFELYVSALKAKQRNQYIHEIKIYSGVMNAIKEL